MKNALFVLFIFISSLVVASQNVGLRSNQIVKSVIIPQNKKKYLKEVSPFQYIGDYQISSGITTPGSSKKIIASLGSGFEAALEDIDTVTFTSGSSDFVIEADHCTGASIPHGQSCQVEVRFTPSSLGVKTATVVITEHSINDSGYADTGIFTFHITAASFNLPVKDVACESGSIVRVTNQSLGEQIPLVGVPFDLFYSSEFAPEYLSSNATFVPAFGFNLEGWTASIHHFYLKDQMRLFLGTGSVEENDYTVLSNGNLMVVSSGEVYIFSPEGKHLETRTYLTGILKYSFAYDGAGKLINIADIYGNQTTFTRDGSGLISSITAPHGQVTTFLKNAQGRFSSVTNPNNETYLLSYKSGTGLLETFTKPGGQVSTFTYDTNGKLLKDLGHGGNFWELGHDVSQNLTKTSNLGRKTTYAGGYDTNGNYSRSEIFPTGFTKVHSESSGGNSYDDYQYQQVTSNQTGDERFNYRAQMPGFDKLVIEGMETSTYYSQNLTYPDGVTRTPFNFLTLTKTANRWPRSVVDKFDNVTKTRTINSGQGVVSKISYDQYERPISTKTGSDVATTFTYDTKGRTVATAQGPKNQLTYGYNNKGLVSSITNGRSESTLFNYDLSGRVTSKIFPDGRLVQYSYDANSNVTSITPPGKPAHYFEFNALELPSKYLPPALSGVTTKDTLYSYNLDKQLTGVTRPSGATLAYNYDATSGLLQTITSSATLSNHTFTYFPNSHQVSERKNAYNMKQKYTYHGDQFKSEEFASNANLTYGKLTYSYDWQNRVNSKTISGRATNDTDTAYITFNNDDQPIQYGQMVLTYSPTSGRLGTTVIGVVKDSYSYDQYGAIVKYNALVSGSSVYSYQLVRDNMSRIVGMTETTLGITKKLNYSYDFAGRLVDVVQDGVSVASFTYDANGNRTNTVLNGTSYASTFDDQDRMLNFGAQTYSYNSNGELQQSVTGIGAQTNYSYDGHGNLVLINLPTNLFSGMYYDSQNRMINKTLLQKNSAGRLVYDEQNRIVGSFSSSGVTEALYHYPTGFHSPDYMRTGGITYRIIKNHLGSPILVVNIDNGSIIQQLTYNTLGKAVVNTNPYFQPFGFAGGFYDHDIKLVKFGARDYDTETGRWLTKDPIGFAGGDESLYGYVGNDPVNFIDVTGLEAQRPQRPEAGVGGVGIGAAAAARECAARVAELAAAAAAGANAASKTDLKGCAKAADAGRLGCSRMEEGPLQIDCFERVSNEYRACIGK